MAPAVIERGHEALPLTHAEIELTEPHSVAQALGLIAPDAIINAAAMNHVERCEREPELAFRINAIGTRNLALASAAAGIPLVHVSTDYVFDGHKPEPYLETDLPSPVNAYGVSKLAGEHFVRALNDRHYVVRTSALYGVNRCRAKPQDNFVRAMLRRARSGDRVRVVSDERVSPTWTANLATQLIELLESGAYGTYHATSAGACSWYEFAVAIFEESGVAAAPEPVSVAAYGSEVRRPSQSVLDNAALRELGRDRMLPWRDALRGFLRQSGELAEL
jgi:dTDP-4-dehydrorhamnose reductase